MLSYRSPQLLGEINDGLTDVVDIRSARRGALCHRSCRIRALFRYLLLLLLFALGALVRDARAEGFRATVSLEDSGFSTFIEPQPKTFLRSAQTAVRLPTAKGSVTVNLTPHDIRAENYRAELSPPPNMSEDQGEVTLYRGLVVGEGGFARTALVRRGDSAELSGLFRAGEKLYSVSGTLQPKSATSSSEITVQEFTTADLGRLGAGCATKSKLLSKLLSPSGLATARLTAKATQRKVLEVATEADYDFVAQRGSGAAANNTILAILNQVDGIYEEQLGISVSVTYQHAWRSAQTPYTSTAPEELIEQFYTHWEENFRPQRRYDVAHLWVSRELQDSVIGIAFTASVCTSDSYSLSQYLAADSFDGPLAAHEIGHTLGAEHDNCSEADAWIMCPDLVESSSRFSVNTKNQIATNLRGVSCLSGSTGGSSPPRLDALTDKTIKEGEALEFDLSASDADGDELTYFASDLPVGATFVGRSFLYVPSYDLLSHGGSRSFRIRFTVSDGALSDTKVVTVTVQNQNRPPLFLPPAPGDGSEGEVFQRLFSAVDQDGDRMSFSASALPAGAVFSPEGELQWRPARGQAGSYQITIAAIDSLGAGRIQTFYLTIVENSTAPILPVRHRLGDFNGDGVVEASVFAAGVWRFRTWSGNGVGGEESLSFGLIGDVPLIADFNGDRISDRGVYRPSNNTFYIKYSAISATSQTTFGRSGDIPAVGDYDGDARADFGVFRPSTGEFLYQQSSDGQTVVVPLGRRGDVVVVGDYDGDGRADPALFRPSTGQWTIREQWSNRTFSFCSEDDVPIPGDWSGTGRMSPACFRPKGALWLINFDSQGFSFGSGSDIPVPADYDGDGLLDPALFRPSEGSLRFLRFGGAEEQYYVGQPTDLPAQAAAQYFAMQNAALSRAELQTSTLFLYQSRVERLRVVTSQTATNFTIKGARGGYLLVGDYNGDTAQDVAVFNGGSWAIYYKQGKSYLSRPQTRRRFGEAGDLPTIGDFDGDGQSDLATVRRNGKKLVWTILRSGSGRTQRVTFGSSGAQPLTGDFNGDGRSDLITTQGGGWRVLDIRSQQELRRFTLPRGQPVVADYDGDGRADGAVFSRSGWSLFLSGVGDVQDVRGVGTVGTPLIGSFTGGTLPDLAMYRATDGRLFVRAQNGSTLVLNAKGGKGSVVVGPAPSSRL